MIAPARGDVRSRGRLPLPRAMAAGLAIAAAVAAHAGDAGSCAPEAVHADTEGQSLTRAEGIARLDRAFHDPAAGSGQVPADIPAPDNDSVLEALIRRVAIVETDPHLRAELWNEYRKYKGLPLKPLPGAAGKSNEGQPLTRAERIARLDRAFYDSLVRFAECQSAATGAGGAAAAGRNGDADGDGDSAGTGDGASMESVAAEGIQGAESPEAPETTADGTSVDGTSADDASIESVAAGGIRGTEAPEAPEDGEKTAADTDRPPVAGSGRTPADIPAPDNDSVLESQIRRAAMEESDPRIRAELWNEYRKYKGLPPKPLPGEEGGNDDAQTSG